MASGPQSTPLPPALGTFNMAALQAPTLTR